MATPFFLLERYSRFTLADTMPSIMPMTMLCTIMTRKPAKPRDMGSELDSPEDDDDMLPFISNPNA